MDVTVNQRGSDEFQLLELSTMADQFGTAVVHGDKNAGAEEDPSSLVMTKRRVLSVRGDGRITMSGGGGVFLEEGDLQVSRGDATFKVTGLTD